MIASEFETLRNDLQAMRNDLQVLRRDVDRIEIKLDAKPSVAALYQAMVVLMFGIGTVVTSTVVILKNVGVMG